MKRSKNKISYGSMPVNHRRTPPGASPGYLSIADDALHTTITAHLFNGSFIDERPVRNFEQLKKITEEADNHKYNLWLDIKGLSDRTLLENIGTYFSIHRLEMEDVINNYQRPKLEEYGDHLFIVSRMIFRKEDELKNEQITFILKRNILISFQEKYEDVLNPVRERLRKGKGTILTSGTGYLLYAIMDTIVDNYFPMLEDTGEFLDELETELLTNPDKNTLRKIHKVKRELIILRRATWPERDKLNFIIRLSTEFITAEDKVFIRDTYDHCVQILDLVESYKEVSSSAMDIYLSSVSNKMNQIMKVLTIISTIFIPLTFIVGLYGMNFSRTDINGHPLKYNMPELYSPYGYVTVLLVMLLIVIIQIYVFFRKGWLKF